MTLKELIASKPFTNALSQLGNVLKKRWFTLEFNWTGERLSFEIKKEDK